MQLSPFIVLLVLVFLFNSVGKSKKRQQEARRAAQKVRQAQLQAYRNAPPAVPEKAPAAPIREPAAPPPSRPEPYQPMFTSDNGEALGEGEDPCHEYMLDQPGPSEPAVRPAEHPAPGMPLSFSKDSLVNAVVMSEILNRRTRRR